MKEFEYIIALTLLLLRLSRAFELSDLVPNDGNEIVMGNVAESSRYPYQALVFIAEGAICGGSLVAPTWVLSAAHCGDVEPITKVQIGRESFVVEGGYEEIAVIRQILHPDYNSEDFTNMDFMLLELATPSTAQVIQLDNGSQPLSGLPLVGGTQVTAVGFGLDFYAAFLFIEFSTFPDLLQEGTYTYWDNWICNILSFPSSGLFTQNTLCAGGFGGTCSGDSGGPLMVKGNDPSNDVQIGVVSFGIVSPFSIRKCGLLRSPDGYARVSVAYSWIQSYIA